MTRLTLCGLSIAALVLVGCKKRQDDAVGGPAPGSAAATATSGADAAAPPAPADAALGVFSADGGPAPTPAEFDSMMNRALTLTEAIGEASARAGTDCGALAADLERLMSESGALFDDFKRYTSNPEVDRQANAWMEAHNDRLTAAMAKARPALMACREDARIKAAFDRLAPMR